MSVMLTMMEDAMRPKKKTLVTEADVKPDASMMVMAQYLKNI